MSDGSRLLPYSSWSSLSSSTSLSISCCPFYSFSSFSSFFQVIHCSCSLSRDTAARLKSNGRPESHLMEGPQQISSMQTTPSRDRAAISSKPGLLCSICLISMPSYSFFPIFLTLSISLKTFQPLNIITLKWNIMRRGRAVSNFLPCLLPALT